MPDQSQSKLNKFYLWIVLLLMLIFPVVSTIIEFRFFAHAAEPVLIAGKWFLFWGVGIRLFTAGLRQAIKPSFTARQIFHINGKDSAVIVKELGFANICLGAIAMLSLLLPQWRPATAFAGGAYMGIAGINHIIKKPVSINEVIAMVSDLFILLVMATYLYFQYV